MAQLFHLSGRAYLDSAGTPYALAKAYFYLTGTTTAQDTYTTAALSVANANPVVAGADGVFGDIYLAAKRYKVVIKDANDVTLRTWDPVDATEQLIASASAPSPTYPFLRYHNTTDGRIYRRNSADSAWIDEGAVDSIGNAASVTETLTGTATNKLTTPDSIAALWQRGSNITPSGGTVSLPSSGGGVFNIAAGNFAAISTAQGGRQVTFVFGGTSVITHDGTSMILPEGADITTEAGDCAVFVNEAAADASGVNWRCVSYQRDSTTLAAVPNYAASQSEMEAASSNLRWVTPGRTRYHPGTCKAWGNIDGTGTVNVRASHDLSSTTDNGTGDYTANKTTAMSSANYSYGVLAGSGTGVVIVIAYQLDDNPTVTALRFGTYQQATAAYDSDQIAVSFHGDE